MSQNMKLWERVIAQRSTQEAPIINPISFYAWEVNYGSNILATKIEGEISEKTKRHMIFTNLEKEYNKVPRKVWWKALDIK